MKPRIDTDEDGFFFDFICVNPCSSVVSFLLYFLRLLIETKFSKDKSFDAILTQRACRMRYNFLNEYAIIFSFGIR